MVKEYLCKNVRVWRINSDGSKTLLVVDPYLPYVLQWDSRIGSLLRRELDYWEKNDLSDVYPEYNGDMKQALIDRLRLVMFRPRDLRLFNERRERLKKEKR